MSRLETAGAAASSCSAAAAFWRSAANCRLLVAVVGLAAGDELKFEQRFRLLNGCAEDGVLYKIVGSTATALNLDGETRQLGHWLMYVGVVYLNL